MCARASVCARVWINGCSHAHVCIAGLARVWNDDLLAASVSGCTGFDYAQAFISISAAGAVALHFEMRSSPGAGSSQCPQLIQSFLTSRCQAALSVSVFFLRTSVGLAQAPSR